MSDTAAPSEDPLRSAGTPQTEAGQVLLREMMPPGPDFPATERQGYVWWLTMILNIEGQARAQYAAALAASPVKVSESEPRYGWHGDGDLCLGPECNVLDADGDHPYADIHSNDWYDGYGEGQKAATLRPEDGLAELRRLKAVEQAARDVDAAWTNNGPTLRWSIEASEALHDLRAALAEPDA